MVKRGFLYFCFLLCASGLYAQKFIDSLRKELVTAKEDSNKAIILGFIATYQESYQWDSNAYYAAKTKELSRRINFPLGLLIAGVSEFFTANLKADYPRALTIALDNLKTAHSMPYDSNYYMALSYLNLSLVERLMHEELNANADANEALRLQKISGKFDGDLWGILSNKASYYKKRNRDSALYYMHQGYEITKTAFMSRYFSCLATATLAGYYKEYKMFPEARNYYQEALGQADYYGNAYIKARIYMNLMQYAIETQHIDSAIYFANKSMVICNQYHYGDYASTVADSLARIYEAAGKSDSALKYLKVMQINKDTVFGQKQIQRFLSVITENENKQKQELAARERLQERVKLYASLAAVLVFILLSGILYLNNRQKQRSFAIIRLQKQETDLQRAKVEQAYQELKSTQNQLIHAEKMASLGELTAGIAHEIQNPLNFVNNFSEVNEELIEEMNKAVDVGNLEEIRALSQDVKQNMEKIRHHGQRADSIVKGMLQHSRASSDQKEPTNLNALADEWLRLAYHGYRAKEKDFNVDMRTAFDPALPPISVIPQDIGRVLLNMYNNAFYSLHEKIKKNGLIKNESETWQPTISITTKKIMAGPDGAEETIEITVRDNGLGIPEKIRDKIFQPFFTNKPPGQGTGLGLSLSYDIVTKEHRGTIQVETREGEFSEFTILLPFEV